MHTPSDLTVSRIMSVGQLLVEPGERKVWIYDLWQVAAPADTTLEQFKSWLVEQHVDGNIELSRMDVARPDETEMAAASEVTYLNASWHRVVIK